MPRLIVVAVALCAIGLSAALLADTPVTVTAQAQTFRPRFQAYGQVAPIQVLTVQAGIAGLIEDLDVVPGQQLKPGDIIARIGGTEQASAIDKARAVQTAAEQAFQAALDAEKAAVKVYPKFSDRAHLDAAKAQLAEARAKLSNAKTEVARLLSLSTVTSPVSGRIVSLKSANGDRVSAGSPVLVMQPQNDLWVEAVFYDISPSVLASGQSAVFKPAGSGAALNVRLAQVAPTLRADG
jgi:multidrug resistance efflux pump